MRIVHINDSTENEAGRLAIRLCRAAEQSGHRSLLCYADGSAPPEIPAYRIGSLESGGLKHGYSPVRQRGRLLQGAYHALQVLLYPFRHLKQKAFALADAAQLWAGRFLHVTLSRISDGAGFHSRFATRRLIRTLDVYQPDLVQLYQLEGYYLHLPTLIRYLQEKQIPVVWTLYDCWPYTGHCASYTCAEPVLEEKSRRRRYQPAGPGCRKWQTGCGHCPCRKDYPSCLFLDRSSRNWQIKRALLTGLSYFILVTMSEWMKQELAHSFLAQKPAYVIPAAVDSRIFAPCHSQTQLAGILEYYGLHSLKGKKLIFAFQEIWDDRTGLDDLAEIAEQLSPEYLIVVAGLDSDQIGAIHQKNLIGLRTVASEKDLAALLTRADVFLSVSRASVSPLALLQAMACGTPVVCWNCCALPEVLTEETGIAIPPGNFSALMSALQHFTCNDSKEIRAARETACTSLAGSFSTDRQAETYLRLYENCYRHSPAFPQQEKEEAKGSSMPAYGKRRRS